ncbi:MAG TPA: ABC transporter ATP-binding protein [Chloroflexota bacterium]|nr:ABC transporter ATP-binding protein [Chloroflexota bacterium]
MAGVRLEHIYKRFGDSIAVNDVNIDIYDREFLVLVGPSGCGKSTTLRLVAGLEELSDGNIYIGERLVNDVPPKDRDIAMVFQSYALYPHMSVYDNLAFGLKLRRTPKREIDERVKRAAETLGIGQLLTRKPRQLSGGQRQRVALGRAIVREPQVFLMDEPLSNLDAKLRVQTRAELIKLHQRLQTTVVYVTHDQTEAMTMGTRIAVMRDGILQQLASPTELYDHPVNVFVAGFIGSPAMNFFRSELRAEGDTLYADTGSIKIQLPPEKRAAASGHQNRQVILGIRPEDIHEPREFQGANGNQATLPVEVVEHMGSETYVYLLAGQTPAIARLDSRTTAEAGKPLPVVFDASRVHLFDPDSEKALTA